MSTGSVDMDLPGAQGIADRLGDLAEDVRATDERVKEIFKKVEQVMSNGAASGNPVDVEYGKLIGSVMEEGRAVLPDVTAALQGRSHQGGKAVAQYQQTDEAVARGLRSSGSHYSH